MRNFYEENNKIFSKTGKLYKNNIIQNLSNITTLNIPMIKKYDKNKFLDIKHLNLKKHNLTSVNLFDYNYDHSRIIERKIKNPLLKLKQDIHYETEYSSFLSKNSEKSELLITGLNSIKKTNAENYYKNLFSDNNKIINKKNSDNKIKSPKYYTKLNIFTFNSFFKKKDNNMIYSPNSLKLQIHFNKDSVYNPINQTGENISSFMEKTRIIRKEKIRRYALDDKIYYMEETNKEKFKIIKIIKDEYFKNLLLYNNYEKCLNRYLRYLDFKISREFKINEQIKKQKREMEREIAKLENRCQYLENEISKYENIKKFLISNKYGYDAIKQIDKYKNRQDFSLFITEMNENDFESKNKNKKYSISKNHFLNEINYNIKYNNKDISKYSDKSQDNIKLKRKNIRKSYSTKIKNKKVKYKIGNIFINLENTIIKNISSYNKKRDEINELNNKLSQIKSFSEGEYYYEKMKISTKVMKIYLLRKDNNVLKKEYNAIKKTSTINDGLKKFLEKKIYNILININKEIDVEKIISIKDLFYLLKMKSDDFSDKMKISKVIYLIKIIELIHTFLINSKIEFLTVPKLKKKYEYFKNLFEKDKNLRILNLNKEKIKKQFEEKKMKFLKQSTKIRFFTYKKYDIKSKQPKKPYIETKIINDKNDSKINYEKWLTYT